jgi:hypothetical protein
LAIFAVNSGSKPKRFSLLLPDRDAHEAGFDFLAWEAAARLFDDID